MVWDMKGGGTLGYGMGHVSECVEELSHLREVGHLRSNVEALLGPVEGGS